MAESNAQKKPIKTAKERREKGLDTFEDTRAFLREKRNSLRSSLIFTMIFILIIAATVGIALWRRSAYPMNAAEDNWAVGFYCFIIPSIMMIFTCFLVGSAFPAGVVFYLVACLVSDIVVAALIDKGTVLNGAILTISKSVISLIFVILPVIFMLSGDVTEVKDEKKHLRALKAKQGSLTEKEYDKQVLARVKTHNEKIAKHNAQLENAAKAEEYYKSALDHTSLTDMKAAADLGHEKAMRFLEPFAEVLEWICSKDVNYSGLFASIEDPKTGKFVNQYLKTCEISENCGTDDLIRLREHGNPNAGRLLAVAGDHAYKQYKEDGVEDPEKLKYITKTLCSPNALIEEALVLYREAKFQTVSPEEAQEKRSSALADIQQALEFVSEEKYKNGATILYYELKSVSSDLTTLENEFKQLQTIQKDENANALFDSFGLDMDYICSNLSEIYERRIKNSCDEANRWWRDMQQKKLQEQAQQSSEFDPTRNYGDYLVATSIDVSDI